MLVGLPRFFGGGAFGAPFFLTVRNVAKVEKYRSGVRIGRRREGRRATSLFSGNFSYSEAAFPTAVPSDSDLGDILTIK